MPDQGMESVYSPKLIEDQRITRVNLPPHGKLVMHSHPSANVVVYVSGGRIKATTADGKSEESTIARGLKTAAK